MFHEGIQGKASSPPSSSSNCAFLSHGPQLCASVSCLRSLSDVHGKGVGLDRPAIISDLTPLDPKGKKLDSVPFSVK